jgi:hypothetical protein
MREIEPHESMQAHLLCGEDRFAAVMTTVDDRGTW